MKMNREKRAKLLFQVVYRNEESDCSVAEPNLVAMDEYLRIYHNGRLLNFNKERDVLEITMKAISNVFNCTELMPISLRYVDRPIYHRNKKIRIGNQSLETVVDISPTKKYDIYRILEICDSFISDCNISFVGECGSYDKETRQYEYDI